MTSDSADPEPTTAALIATALGCDVSDGGGESRYWDIVRTLYERGGQGEFDAARLLIGGLDADERTLGANILSQLGSRQPKPFDDEAIALLIAALGDPVDTVRAAAASALGHRHSLAAVPHLLGLIADPFVEVRRGVVFGLSCVEDRRATDGLIRLCHDDDAYVRDWASFGLAEQCEIDYPELRDQLRSMVHDPNPEVRGQAMIGLARRGDRGCIEAVLAELSGEHHGSWAIEAAGHLADTSLVEALEKLRDTVRATEPDYHIAAIDESIAACRSGIPTAD
jgi:HEAT repeat protein